MSLLKKLRAYDDKKKKHFAFFSSLVITFIILITYIVAFLPITFKTDSIAEKEKPSPFALVAGQIEVLLGK